MVEPLSQRQFAVIDRFYSAVRAIYGSKFDQQFHSEQDVIESKQMWGPDISAKKDVQLLACIQNAKSRIKTGDQDWMWPNMGLILGHVESSWEHAATRLDFTGTAQLEDLTAKERRIEEGKKHMADIMGMFS